MPIKHLSENQLRAYLDGERAPHLAAAVEMHLPGCSRCQAVMHDLEASAGFVKQNLDLMGADQKKLPVSASQARIHLKSYISRKDKESMLPKIFSRRVRPAWIGAALILLLAVSLFFPPMRAIANSFLGLFRVQQVTVVSVESRLPDQFGSSSSLEELFSRDVRIEQDGVEEIVANAEKAGQLAGIAVRLPTAVEGDLQLKVLPSARMTFQVELKLVNAILQEIGREELVLPAELDGMTVTADLPRAVVAMYGDCERSLEEARQAGYDPDDPAAAPLLPGCTTFTQMRSPEIHAPAGLDLTSLGEIYLQVMGMSPEEAARFSRNIDWSTTLVLPMPVDRASYRELLVDGVTGTLIMQRPASSSSTYLLIWVKDGMAYGLMGAGSSTSALEIATSLE